MRVDSELDQAGFTLIEVITAAVIAVIAVMGLAFTFSAGRGMIDRYAAARAALAAAEDRMERLSVLGLRDPANADLSAGSHPAGPPLTVDLNGVVGSEQWTVTWVDDPADNAGVDVNPNDYKLVTVRVSWNSGTVLDHVELKRFILGS